MRKTTGRVVLRHKSGSGEEPLNEETKLLG
jgi:hypothetical protein